MELRYSPRYHVAVRAGAFHAADDPGYAADALSDPNPRVPIYEAAPAQASSGALQALVDRFTKDSAGRTVVGALPVRVAFPEFGKALFIASELTAENVMPSIELDFTRTK